VNVQVNSCTHPLPQSKAQAAICIVFWPGTTGEVLKWKAIVVSPLLSANELAGVPLTVKALAWTVAGLAGALRLIMKSVGWLNITLGQEVVTEQPEGVGVGVGVEPTSSLLVKASGWYVPLMGTRPSIHEERCLVANAEA
jgi:hypothetical protein